MQGTGSWCFPRSRGKPHRGPYARPEPDGWNENWLGSLKGNGREAFAILDTDGEFVGYAVTGPIDAASSRVAEKAGYTFEWVLRSMHHVDVRRVDLQSWSILPGELLES